MDIAVLPLRTSTGNARGSTTRRPSPATLPRMTGQPPRRWRVRAASFVIVLTLLAGPMGSSPASASTLRSRMFRLINHARVQHDRRELKLHVDLSQVARKHTRRMIRRNAIFHSKGITQILSRYGYRLWGENVGCASSVWALHKAFMNSAPHRENILKKGFRWVGLGVLHDDGKSICGSDSVWATEIFYG